MAAGVKGITTSEAARAMGSVKSEAKAAAVRENGKRGGRPAGQTLTQEQRDRISEGMKRRAAEKKAALGAAE